MEDGNSNRLSRKLAIKSKSFSTYKGKPKQFTRNNFGNRSLSEFDPCNSEKRGDASGNDNMNLIDLSKPLSSTHLKTKIQHYLGKSKDCQYNIEGVTFVDHENLSYKKGNMFCVGLHRYVPQNVDEISISPGDILQYLGQLEYGWWFGKLILPVNKNQSKSLLNSKNVGVFPAGFVKCFIIQMAK